jgi:hypothetical protein
MTHQDLIQHIAATNGDVDFEHAREVLREARRMLVIQLQSQENHEHMLDDCGDYLYAATENWNRLFSAYWENDGDETAFVRAVREFLKESPTEWLGCDGEIRYDLWSDEYVERRFATQEN